MSIKADITPVESTGLHYRAELASLTIRRWGARRKTDQAEAVATQTGGKKKAFNVTKRLVDPRVLKPVNDVYSGARSAFTKNTLEWQGDQRLIAGKKLSWFIEAMAYYEEEFFKAVDGIVAAYPGAIRAAERELGTDFVRHEYPTENELRQSYQFFWNTSPVPTAGDMRCEVDPEVAQRLRNQGRKAQEDALEIARNDMLQRMGDILKRCSAVFSADNGEGRAPRITDALITDIAQIANTFDTLNVMDDPDIVDLTADFKANLAPLTTHGVALREDPALRSDAKHAADALSSKLSAFI